MNSTPEQGSSPVSLRPPLVKRQIEAVKAIHREDKGAEWYEVLVVGLQVLGKAEPKNSSVDILVERNLLPATVANASSRDCPALVPPGLKVRGGGCFVC